MALAVPRRPRDANQMENDRSGLEHLDIAIDGLTPAIRIYFQISPRSVLEAVVPSNARHCPISPVGPIPGSRAAREFEAHSACWRQLAVVQHIPIGILRLKRSWI